MLVALAALLGAGGLVVVLYWNARPAAPVPEGGGTVVALVWKRPVKAGEEIDPGDVRVVEVARARLSGRTDVLSDEALNLLDGAWALRARSAGDFVLRRDVQPFVRPEQTGPRVGLGTTRPGGPDLKPIGGGRYISTTQTAVGGGPFGPRPRARTPGATSAPADLLAGALAAGPGRLRGPVPGAIVPEGAIRLYAFRHRLATGPADMVAYAVGLGLDEAEKFYKTRLAGDGYNLVQRGDTARATPGVALVFRRADREYYYVNLHPTRDDTKVKAVLIIPRAAGARPGGNDPARRN